jgi:ArsR family transcriptional regulator
MKTGLETLETTFQALGDRTRLRILALLAQGEVCVCDIHENLALPQPKVSRHLAYLRRAGLVATRRQGLWVHYRLADDPDGPTRAILAAVGQFAAAIPELERDRGRLAACSPSCDCCCQKHRD